MNYANGHPIIDDETPLPRVYHVHLAPELARALEVYAAASRHQPETIIAACVRDWLGVDA